MVKNNENYIYSQKDQEHDCRMSTFLPQDNKKRTAILAIKSEKSTIQPNTNSLSSSRLSSTFSSASSNVSSSKLSDIRKIQTSVSKKLNTYNALTSEIECKNDKKYCSSNSSSISDVSASLSTPIDHKLDYNDSILSMSHREMAIDCPEYFVPEIKTRPSCPPLVENHSKQNNLLKPLLNIINNHINVNKSNENVKELKNTRNYNFIKKNNLTGDLSFAFDDNYGDFNNKAIDGVENIALKTMTKSTFNCPQPSILNEELPLISSSFSSIQYIDEDNKSKILSEKSERLIEAIKQNSSNVDKFIFDKQQVKRVIFEDSFIRNSLHDNTLKNTTLTLVSQSCGMINNAFENDDYEDGNKEIEFDIKFNEKHIVASSDIPKKPYQNSKNITISKANTLQNAVSFCNPVDIVNLENQDLCSNQFNILEAHHTSNNRIILHDLNDKIYEKSFIQKLCKVYETNNFQNTINLYDKIIHLNSKLEMMPLSLNIKKMSEELLKLIDLNGNIYEIELNSLLTKFQVQSLFSTHDQLAAKFEEVRLELQNQNKKQVFDLNSCHSQSNNRENNVETLNKNQELIEDDLQITDEGRFLLSKAQYYSVENLKLVNIEKKEEPFGATIRNKDGNIVICRIIAGGSAEQSGLLHEDDEILEINNIPIRGKTINDVCDMLNDIQGIVSFLIIPNMEYEKSSKFTSNNEDEKKNPKMFHIRALFNYVPQEDLYIPCKELGLSFNKGDILHVISQEDSDWWQAYRGDDKDSLAGLIPSQSFQERRYSQMQAIIGDSFMTKKKREKGFCIGKSRQNRRRLMVDDMINSLNEEIVTYEQVTLYRAPSNKKRPIVLIGPHSIGRHELRKRLIQTNPSLFEVVVPHTTRSPRRNEIDGKDYHFLPRHIFEADIRQGRFIEHGEYEKNLYGTSYEAIKKVIENNKICVLNLYPQALKTLRSTDLMPYIVYIGPPNLARLKELKVKMNENYKENDLLDLIDKGREIEEIYGHYFDKIIRNTDMNKTYDELFETIKKIQIEENWVPSFWLRK